MTPPGRHDDCIAGVVRAGGSIPGIASDAVLKIVLSNQVVTAAVSEQIIAGLLEGSVKRRQFVGERRHEKVMTDWYSDIKSK